MDNSLTPVDCHNVILALALLVLPPAVWCLGNETQNAGIDKFVESEAFEFSQGAVGRRISDFRFTDSDDRSVNVSTYLGRPVIVSFIYTSCHHTCPLLTRRIARAVDAARGVFGANGFHVLTVGFDSDVDTPARMRIFASSHGVSEPGWDFLSADKETISAFATELGFVFFASPKGFDHLAQTTILDKEGRVYRQIYGEELEPPDIIEPLKELAFGQREEKSMVAGWVDGIRLFCTVYDPASGRYRFDYSVFVAAITGIICLGAVAIFILHGWRQHRASGRPGA